RDPCAGWHLVQPPRDPRVAGTGHAGDRGGGAGPEHRFARRRDPHGHGATRELPSRWHQFDPARSDGRAALRTRGACRGRRAPRARHGRADTAEYLSLPQAAPGKFEAESATSGTHTWVAPDGP